jgi:hypothetical protein
VRRTTALLQLTMLVVALPLFSPRLQAQSSQSVPRNLLGGELLGRGGLYSINYERLLTNRIGAGGGISLLSLSGGGLFSASGSTTTVILPTYVSWTPVGRTHSPYLSGGFTLLTSRTREFFLGNTESNVGAFGTLTAGYQYRSESGIVIRPFVSHISIDEDNFWWPGITLGVSF